MPRNLLEQLRKLHRRRCRHRRHRGDQAVPPHGRHHQPLPDHRRRANAAVPAHRRRGPETGPQRKRRSRRATRTWPTWPSSAWPSPSAKRSSKSSPAASPLKSTPASPTTLGKPLTRPAPSSSSITPRKARPQAHPHQDRLHLGRHPRRGSPGKRRHPLQPHPALRHAPGHRLRRSRRHPHLPLRRPHPRLVQERHRQGLSGRRRSRRPVGHPHLQLLQELRLQDRRSWAPASATSAKSTNWPDATCSPSRRNCSPSSNPLRAICPASSTPQDAKAMTSTRIPMDKATFDRMHAADRMASDKLKEGIEGFSAALVKSEICSPTAWPNSSSAPRPRSEIDAVNSGAPGPSHLGTGDRSKPFVLPTSTPFAIGLLFCQQT